MTHRTGPEEDDRPSGDQLLCEGGVSFTSPGVCPTERGPGARAGPSFYNRAMAPNRDLAEEVVAVLARGFGAARGDGAPFRVLDGMASSGVRGLRFIRRLVEMGGVERAGTVEGRASEPLPGESTEPGTVGGPPAGMAAVLTLNDIDRGATRTIIGNVGILGRALGGDPVATDAGTQDEGEAVHFTAGFPAGVQVEITARDVRSLTGERRFNYIDIDPYGTPAPYIPSALSALFKGGVAGFTATDTAALCGVYPRTALRRYGARTFKSHLHHEMGVRILAGACVRAAAAMDLGCRPVLVQSADHFMRVYMRMEGKAEAADSILEEMGFLMMDGASGRMWTRTAGDPSEFQGSADGSRPHGHGGGSALAAIWGVGMDGGEGGTSEDVPASIGGDGIEVAGPLWLGGLFDPSLLRELQRESASPHPLGRDGGDAARADRGDAAREDGGDTAREDVGEAARANQALSRWLDIAGGEAEAPPFFYDIDRLCSLLSISPPKKNSLKEAFLSAGHTFSFTTFSPVGFKTAAPYEDVLEVVRSLAEGL